jgi:hypothetical protein
LLRGLQRTATLLAIDHLVPDRQTKGLETMLRKIMLVLVILLVGWAFVLGYWPQHEQVLALQDQNAQLKKQAAGADSLGRLTRLENELLQLIEQSEGQNYGEAQKLSNTYFDDLRREIDQDKGAPYAAKLEMIMARRDAVTAGLARAEAPTVGPLKQSLAEMRELLLVLTR